MGRYIQIDINIESEAEKDILVARLAGIGFEGFEEEANILRAFIPEPDLNERLLKKTLEDNGQHYSKKIVEEENWNSIWEESFEPVIIRDFCSIRAEFHAPVPGVEHEIIITPKMSFGTGHHATTSMMIEAMRQFDFKEKSVFDFGTGTGILSILAEKMGASAIEAIDNDDWSIENGKENLKRNNCKRITLYKSDHIASCEKFDIMLVNITKNVIIKHLPSIGQHVAASGVYLISGILEDDFEEIMMAFEPLDLELFGRQQKNRWVCLQLRQRV